MANLQGLMVHYLKRASANNEEGEKNSVYNKLDKHSHI